MRQHYTLQIIYQLPTALARLLLLLIEKPIVTAVEIEHEHQIATQASVAIHRLRRRIAPYKIEVKSQKSLGYFIDHETKIAVIDQMKRIDVVMPPRAA